MTLVRAADAASRSAAAKRVRQNIDRMQTMTEGDLADILRELQTTRQRLVAQLAGRGSEFDQAFARSMIAEVDREVARLRQALGPKFASTFRKVMDSGAVDTNALIRDLAPFPVMPTSGIDSALINFARDNSADLVGQITEDMRTRINSALRRGATGSSTPTDMGRVIGDVVREAGRDPGVFGNVAVQTERILRTETSRLYQGAAQSEIEKTAERHGDVVTKVWISYSRQIPGSEARPDHVYLDGVEIGHREHFNVGAGPTWSRVSYEEAQRRGGVLGFKAVGPQDSILPASQAVNCKCGLTPGFRE